jgi:hypothetical protein
MCLAAGDLSIEFSTVPVQPQHTARCTALSALKMCLAAASWYMVFCTCTWDIFPASAQCGCLILVFILWRSCPDVFERWHHVGSHSTAVRGKRSNAFITDAPSWQQALDTVMMIKNQLSRASGRLPCICKCMHAAACSAKVAACWAPAGCLGGSLKFKVCVHVAALR